MKGVKGVTAIKINKGNNQKLLNKLSNRMDIGIVKFGQEMPIDGTYNIEDALEEALDLSIYLASQLMHIRQQKKNNG